MPASSPSLTSSSSTSKPRRFGPAHQHPQHHLGPVLRVGAARARVDGHERIARVVGPREQPLLLERGQPLLDGGDLLVDLALQRGVLAGHLGEAVEILDVGLAAPGSPRDAARRARARPRPPRPARSRPRSRRRPSRSSSAATRSASPAGSKIVREQFHLLADRGQALRSGLAGVGGGHASTLSAAGHRAAPASAGD